MSWPLFVLSDWTSSPEIGHRLLLGVELGVAVLDRGLGALDGRVDGAELVLSPAPGSRTTCDRVRSRSTDLGVAGPRCRGRSSPGSAVV